jgi:uncharacterized protein (TIGR00730 family)
VKRVCVFCGSSAGLRPDYADAARALARELVRRRLAVVYGGGSVGLMGILADAALAEGGEVIGVIPRGLASRELLHTGVTELRVVESMHERKATMAELADAFVALPGGLGTLEETLEVLTWSQLGIRRKPVALLNVRGYWDALLRLLTHAADEGFVRREYLGLLLTAEAPAELVERLAGWQAPGLPQAWLDSRDL